MPDPDFAALVQRQLDAYNTRDAAAFAACFSADVRCQRHPDEAPFLQGREALQTLVRCLRLTGKTEEASRMAESLAKLDQRLDETLRQLQQQGKVSP